MADPKVIVIVDLVTGRLKRYGYDTVIPPANSWNEKQYDLADYPGTIPPLPSPRLPFSV